MCVGDNQALWKQFMRIKRTTKQSNLNVQPQYRRVEENQALKAGCRPTLSGSTCLNVPLHDAAVLRWGL